jgi:protein-S-isoprenylcysteine O-methyltransferase Ste14
VFGIIYGLGFSLGYLSFSDGAPKAAFVVWGDRLAGPAGATILVWTAIASALVAWLWRASGTAYLRRDVVFASDVQRDRLIVAGPFRYVRNPLYLGNMFLALGIAIMAPPLGFAIIVAGNAVFVALLAAEESRELARMYGATYDAFRAAVPAFVPRLSPATVPGSVSIAPSWRSAILGESFCLVLAVALVPIALYRDAGLPAFWAIGACALVLFGLLGWMAGRKRVTDGHQ